MDVTDPALLRSVVLAGHSGSGKTTLTEAFLVASGALTRAGRVENGNTASDFDPFEQQLGHSVGLSVLSFDWRGHRINVLDAPGHADFVGEVVSGLAGAEAALILVNAAAGVQPGTRIAWDRANGAGVRARAFVVTHLDHEKVDFERIVEEIRDQFGDSVGAAALPGNSPGEVHDLVRAEAGAEGGAYDAARERLIEIAAESSDELMEGYLEGKPVSPDLLASGVRAAIATGALSPVIPAYPLANVEHLLNFIIDLIPPPTPEATTGTDFVARVIKTTIDPFAGLLSVVKVVSGTLAAGTQITNPRTGAHERAPHLFLLRGHEQTETPRLIAGEVGAIPKLAHALPGDTLTSGTTQVLPDLEFPVPTYRSAIAPHAVEDFDRLGSALARLREQDRTLHIERDMDTAEMILTTIGPAQAELAVGRVKKQFGLAVDLTPPRIPYRETISGSAQFEYRHKKQTGGRGQFGHVILKVEARESGAGFAFVDQVVGGAVPKNFIPAVEAGVVEALGKGPLAGSQVIDVGVTLLGGSSHPVDSSEMAFKLAAGHALKEALTAARPELLEPVMHVTIHVSADHLGDVMGDLTGRRGTVRDVQTIDGVSVIDAFVPLAEVQRYAPELSALSGGRGSVAMELDHYAMVPAQVRDRLLAKEPAHPTHA